MLIGPDAPHKAFAALMPSLCFEMLSTQSGDEWRLDLPKSR